MRIGIDVDGVLANFFSAYEEAIVQEAGEDKFPCRYPECTPPVWDWPEHYGYDKAYVSRVWKKIAKSRSFWYDLDELPDLAFLKEAAPWAIHAVYYITARPGENAKAQTEYWLEEHGIPAPTVLISKEKGLCAQALQLDLYIDDKLENIVDVQDNHRLTRAYLCPQYPYNLDGHVELRAQSIQEVFEREGVR